MSESPETTPLSDLAAFASLLEAEWYNGNLDEKAYLRLNADLTGIVAKHRATLDAARATVPAGTCDWGDCDEPAIGLRNDASGHGFLPVCQRHWDGARTGRDLAPFEQGEQS